MPDSNLGPLPQKSGAPPIYLDTIKTCVAKIWIFFGVVVTAISKQFQYLQQSVNYEPEVTKDASLFYIISAGGNPTEAPHGPRLEPRTGDSNPDRRFEPGTRVDQIRSNRLDPTSLIQEARSHKLQIPHIKSKGEIPHARSNRVLQIQQSRSNTLDPSSQIPQIRYNILYAKSQIPHVDYIQQSKSHRVDPIDLIPHVRTHRLQRYITTLYHQKMSGQNRI